MKTINGRIFEEALSLPADSRLNLIEKLLMSLNLPLDKEIDLLWAEEAERRVSQINEDKTNLVPGDEVFAGIRARHKK